MEVLQFKKANCKNCYKCVRNCPVKAIEVKNHQAQIIDADCILCGNCITVCPQNAKRVREDLPHVKKLITQGKKVIASVAPSYIATYRVSGFASFEKALQALGFFAAQETARGAYLVKTRYEQLVDEHWQGTIISSCCPTAIRLMQKYYPKTLKFLAPVLSPMQAHAREIKREHPDAVVVFIGPCISKKQECIDLPGLTDWALTFEELSEWFQEKEIILEEELSQDTPAYLSRFFPVSGGILQTMKKSPDYQYLAMDGPESCIEALREIEKGRLQGCFVEMSACSGSCVGGHATGRNSGASIDARLRVERAARYGTPQTDYNLPEQGDLARTVHPLPVGEVPPSEEQLTEILHKMGKFVPSDELNCGTCGYSTCREKAAAVYWGKAEIEMCLPFMMARAQSFSDKIISITPNAIVAVDSSLQIRQINQAACSLLSIDDPAPLIGRPVSQILDEFDFVDVIASQEGKSAETIYLAEHGKYVERSLLYDENNQLVICIMKDVTGRELRHEHIAQRRSDAAALTDQIVEKQLRIVHEIASLLGETAAETQIALTELKNIIAMEDEQL